MSTTRVIPADRNVMIEKQIVVIECANCSIDFGIGAHFQKRRRDDHETFYCPNGHPNCYPQQQGKSEAEKLNEWLSQQLKMAHARADSWKDQAETAEARRRGQKAANTRLKKRIAAGVCPCCRRSFEDLARHIAGQHPDFAGGSDE